MTAPCHPLRPRRRRLFGNDRWNGLDFVELLEDGVTLCLHFFGDIPSWIGAEHFRIEGGRRITGLQILSVSREAAADHHQDPCLRIVLDRPGDLSEYRLQLIQLGPPDAHDGAQLIDPRYGSVTFRFHVDCASENDSEAADGFETLPGRPPEIDYLAKDYASFRQLMLDRLAVTMPDWRERHAADIGVTLVELLAYVGDHLSYRQDATATEAYLDTARQRISVRRHVRLVDYRISDGANARALLTLTVPNNVDLDPLQHRFTTKPAASARAGEATPVFEIVPLCKGQLSLRPARNEIHFHTWGGDETRLPKGSTRATLVGDNEALGLEKGCLLVIVEACSPTTMNRADADPTKRQAVRLTRVTPGVDGLLGVTIVEVEWSAEDALAFDFYLSARAPAPDCDCRDNLTVARGNVILVDEGATVTTDLEPVDRVETVGDCACCGSIVEWTMEAAPFAARLPRGPVVVAAPVDSCASARRLLTQDPTVTLPLVSLIETPPDAAPSDGDPVWSARYDLLSSGPADRVFVAELDDERLAHLRFGDGVFGRRPPAGARFTARYRVGGGAAGNVGRDTIVVAMGLATGLVVEATNPLAATGGADPETLSQIRLAAPYAYRRRRERAISAADYAEIAEASPQTQRAAAELAWTGSWYEARVAIDPAAQADTAPDLIRATESRLGRVRRIGHDLAVAAAEIVPLRLTLRVCVAEHFNREQVRRALERRLGAGSDGFRGRGSFHPDELSFGSRIASSSIAAAALQVPGVCDVHIELLARLDGTATADDEGVLGMSAWEIPRLDNDPNVPEHGVLKLKLEGGR